MPRRRNIAPHQLQARRAAVLRAIDAYDSKVLDPSLRHRLDEIKDLARRRPLEG